MRTVGSLVLCSLVLILQATLHRANGLNLGSGAEGVASSSSSSRSAKSETKKTGDHDTEPESGKVTPAEPLVVEPGGYDDPVLQDAPRQGIYKDDDVESTNRFVKDVRHACSAYEIQCRTAEKEICKWYGFPKEAGTCEASITEHLKECEAAAGTWMDLKKEARKDVYREINKGYGTNLPAASASFFLQRRQRDMVRGKRILWGEKNKARLGYSPRARKHFKALCVECQAAGDLPDDDPGHAQYNEIRGICKCAQEYGSVAALHEKAEKENCGADE